MSHWKWSDLTLDLMYEDLPVFVILDCCKAGGADTWERVVGATPGQPTHAKELLAACGWKSKSRGEMTDDLCTVFSQCKEDPVSTSDLWQRLRDRMSRKRGVSQPYRASLVANTEHDILLP